MEWWNEGVGTYAAFFGNYPALAMDFATNSGMHQDMGGANMAAAIQSNPTPMPVYEGGS